MLEDIFVKSIAAIEAAAGPGAVVEKGANAIAQGSNKPARVFLTDRLLQQGDIISLPKMEGEDDLARWLYAPAVPGGDPVLHCLGRISRGSQSLSFPIFIGNFVKEVTALDGTSKRNTVVDKAGSAIDLVTTCANLGEQWRILAGRTFVVKTITPVKTMKRNRKTMVAYEGSASIYELTEV